MAKHRKSVCPGCSRHCSAENVRCKYGRKYFGNMQKADAGCIQQAEERPKRYKWEKLVMQGGLVWKLLWIGSRCKSALRNQKLTEQELLSALDDAEKAHLEALLEKITGSLE